MTKTSNDIKRELNQILPLGTKISVRTRSNRVQVTFVEYPHNLVSLGAVVESLAGKKPTRLIGLPWSAQGQISPLLSREGKRVTKTVLSLCLSVVTVAPSLWWCHFLQRNHELGVLPYHTEATARFVWTRPGAQLG